MQILLKYTLFVEPDRQRLSNFVMYAVENLGGNIFYSTTTLSEIMRSLRKAMSRSSYGVAIKFYLEERNLFLQFEDENHRVIQFSTYPLTDNIDIVAKTLKQQSESASPELLQIRNEKIISDLDRAKKQAADELQQLEYLLENKRLELEQAQIDAETDSLTGLFNHRAYDKRFKEALTRAQRQSEPLCLMMLDLDNFKEVNDTHGHVFGDQYLRKMSDSMKNSCRSEVDVCCRLGGDEFAIIVFSDTSTTKRIARTILERMEMRVSIGIAQALSEDTTITLMERCDSELYKAKERGRGQIAASHITMVRQNKSK